MATLALALARGVLHAPSPTRPRSSAELRSGIEFALIAPGAFRMGTPDDEQGREAGEVLGTVTISRPFYVGRYEVPARWQLALRRRERTVQAQVYAPAAGEGYSLGFRLAMDPR